VDAGQKKGEECDGGKREDISDIGGREKKRWARRWKEGRIRMTPPVE